MSESLPESLPKPLPEFPCLLTVPEDTTGRRLDAFLAESLAAFSRATLRRAIDAGHVTVDDQQRKPSFKISAGQQVHIAQVETPKPGPEPEPIPLDFLYEDEHMVVVNKPAGMIVHPAKGHWAGTMASALAYHFGDSLSGAGGPARPGIVHRLDRDTSGVIVVAKHDAAHHALAAQFKDRTTEKEYLALVLGCPDRDADIIDQPVGPHPKYREQMAVRPDHPDSRTAQTRWEVVQRWDTRGRGRFTHLRCLPKTGRTHQIRVHLAHDGHPVLCDKLYGGRSEITVAELSGSGSDDTVVLARQALHACRISINHPVSGERLTIEAPLPTDIEAALCCLRQRSE